MQGAPQGRPRQRPPQGRDPGSPHPASHAAAGHSLLRAGAEGTPVGLPTRGRGVSTVSRPENPAQGAAEGGARCRESRGATRMSSLPLRRARASHDRGVRPARCLTPRPGERCAASAGASPPPSSPPLAPGSAKLPQPGRLSVECPPSSPACAHQPRPGRPPPALAGAVWCQPGRLHPPPPPRRARSE